MKIKPYAFPRISELSLQLAWNDAIESGEVPLENSEGTQFLSLGFSTIVMRVRQTTHGWNFGFVEEATVRDAYRKADREDLYDLRPAKKPYRLE